MESRRKNPELDVKHQAILKSLMQLPENKVCADCHASSPRWASANLGVFLCISCSGLHRRLGSHISQVRSVTLDTWTPEQISTIQSMGNAKAAEYYEACVPPTVRRPHSGDLAGMERWIRDKYEKKLYVRKEDGGLGGFDDTEAGNPLLRNQFSPFETSASSPSVFGSVSGGRSRWSRSYAERFRMPMSYRHSGSSSYQGIGGAFDDDRAVAAHRSTSSQRNISPYKRAAAMKTLLDMGFEAAVAARAIEASGGDIEGAVDWVLMNNPNTNEKTPPRSREAEMPPASDTGEQSEANLLDFGDEDDATPDTTKQKEPPRSREILADLFTSSDGNLATKDAEDDFADFGEFEGADSTPKSFTSSLSALYKKSVPKAHSASANTPQRSTETRVQTPLNIFAQPSSSAQVVSPGIVTGAQPLSIPSSGHIPGPPSKAGQSMPIPPVTSASQNVPRQHASPPMRLRNEQSVRPTSLPNKAADSNTVDDLFADLVPAVRSAFPKTSNKANFAPKISSADGSDFGNDHPQTEISLDELLGDMKLSG